MLAGRLHVILQKQQAGVPAPCTQALQSACAGHAPCMPQAFFGPRLWRAGPECTCPACSVHARLALRLRLSVSRHLRSRQLRMQLRPQRARAVAGATSTTSTQGIIGTGAIAGTRHGAQQAHRLRDRWANGRPVYKHHNGFIARAVACTQTHCPHGRPPCNYKVSPGDTHCTAQSAPSAKKQRKRSTYSHP